MAAYRKKQNRQQPIWKTTKTKVFAQVMIPEPILKDVKEAAKATFRTQEELILEALRVYIQNASRGK